MGEHLPYQSPQGHQHHRRGLRSLPAIGVVLLIGVSLYASRAAVPPAPDAVQPGQAAGEPKGDDKTTAKEVAAANAFLEALDANQRGRALFDFDSGKKSGWSNLPVTMVPRNGVRLGELKEGQRKAALELLAAVLSKDGYQKVIDIMEADDQLVKGGNQMKFGTNNYYLAVFGKPSAAKPWMVQFGGHHLGLNVTVVGKNSVVTPTHTGTQPEQFMRNGKTVRPLGPENDLGFKLVNALDDKQRAKAIIAAKPINLVLGPGQDNKKIEPVGVKGLTFTDAQRAILLDLVAAWVKMLPEGASAKRLAEIKGELDDTYFAWYGPTKNGSAVYYRVQGPTLVIEYAPQGSTNHIHTIIRNPKDDYGKQLTGP